MKGIQIISTFRKFQKKNVPMHHPFIKKSLVHGSCSDPKDMYCNNNNTEWKKYCENAVLKWWKSGDGVHSRRDCGKLILILHIYTVSTTVHTTLVGLCHFTRKWVNLH